MFLHTDALEAVADLGYFSSPEILSCHEAGITVTVWLPRIPSGRIRTVRENQRIIKFDGGRVPGATP